MFLCKHRTTIAISLIIGLDRFIFNGFRAMIVLFLVKSLLYPDAKAFSIYGTLMMLAFLTPIVGGWISDRYLDKKFSIFIGFLWSLVGSLLLYLDKTNFFIGSSLILVGTGMVRPSAFPLFSDLIGRDSSNRDTKFTFLYAFMNLSTFLGTLVCAVLGECIAWEFTFLAMIVANCAALVVLICLENKPIISVKEFSQKMLGLCLAVAFTVLVFLFFRSGFNIPGSILTVVLLSVLVFCFIRLSTLQTDYKKLEMFGFTIIFTILFFICYEQSGNSMVLFADNNVDRNFGFLAKLGINFLPTTFFQLVDPIFNLILGSIIAMIWSYLERKNITIKIFSKMSLGILFVGIGFLILALSSFFSHEGLVSPLFLIMGLMFFVIGELCIVPVGLSFITKIAPQENASFYIGVWYFSIGIAQYLAGHVATLVAFNENETSLDVTQNLVRYTHFFNELFLICLGVTATLYLTSRIRRINLG
ncbi:MAG: hypothetical protein BGO67_04400 [Alphaproteobacteria bacterium 41-28]|nr:MAG: hypothetical protein BGO67_04400 [Alphaproteobacteria bacterium 41-28]